MTPAIKLLQQQHRVFHIHEYHHDPGTASYGLEAAEKIGMPPEQVFKTLVVALDAKQLLVAILPVNQQLSLKKLAKVAGGKKTAMASPDQVERTTGYVLGGVSPLGQKKSLPTFIDQSAKAFAAIYVSAGKRGLDLELAPSDLQELTQAVWTDLI